MGVWGVRQRHSRGRTEGKAAEVSGKGKTGTETAEKDRGDAAEN